MTIFTKFQNTDLEDIVDEEIAKQNRRMRRASQGAITIMKLNEEGDEESDSESDEESDEGEVHVNKGWKQLRRGGLSASLSIENKEKHRLKIKMQEEAKLLAAICYQHGMYLPPEAGNHVTEMHTKSVNLWTK